ncbi:MAG: hypothetical protein WCM76_06635 [Bacteroidota bacterium]
MLKKSLHIIVILILLISTSGVIIDRHFCGNSLVSTTLGKSADCCKDHSCCRHEIHFYKIGDSFQSSQVSMLCQAPVDTAACPVLVSFLSEPVSAPVLSCITETSPPEYRYAPSFLQVFLL